jgi:Tol biopolymer transport system component
LRVRLLATLVVSLSVVGGATGATAAPASAPGGRIAFWVEGTRAARLYTVRPDGTGRRLLSRFKCCRISSEFDPAWSRDGKQLAFVRGTYRRSEVQFEIFVTGADGTRPRQLTRGGSEGEPAWSPDGRMIACSRNRVNGVTSSSIFSVDAASGDEKRLTDGSYYDDWPAWSPDGTTIAFSRGPAIAFVDRPARWRLMLVDSDGSRVRPFPRNLFGQQPAWSRDGRWLAFVSYRDRYGQTCDRDNCYPAGEIYVVRADGSGLRRLTRDKADGRSPTWSPDGKWIAFARGRSAKGPHRFRLYRVPTAGGKPSLVTQMPRGAYDPAWSR